MSSTTVYMSDQYASRKMTINVLSSVILASVLSVTMALAFWGMNKYEENAGREQCDEIAKNSSYVTKFTGKTCWIRINDGADGVTSEAWIPSEWMTMG